MSSSTTSALQRIETGRIQIRKNHQVGSGNFADVFEGLYTHPDGTTKSPVAVKVARSKTDPRNSSDSYEHDTCQELLNEASAMASLKHRNVIECIGMSMDKIPNIVMELCVGGSLEKHLKTSKNIKTVDRVQFMYEISLGMRYLEACKVVHRDLATRNVLISAAGVLKISDFGLTLTSSTTISKDKDYSKTQIPIRWLSPETLTKNPVFSSKSDVWAFGTTVYEIFNNGEKLWPDANVKWIATQIRRAIMPTLPSSMPTIIQEFLLKCCWVKDVKERWDFVKINALINFYQIALFSPHQAQLYSIHKPKRGVVVTNEYADQKFDSKAVLIELPEFVDAKNVKMSMSKIGFCPCRSEAELEVKMPRRASTPTVKSVRKKKYDVTQEESEFRSIKSVVEKNNNNTSCENTKEIKE